MILSGGVLDATGEFRVAKAFRGAPVDVLDLDRLGVDDRDLNAFASLDWRVTDRWSLGLDVFQLEVSGGRQVDFDFEYGDLLVPVGARVDSELDLAFYVLSLSYSVYRSDRLHVGLGLGVHGVDTRYDLSARTTVGGTETLLGSESDDFIAPLPNLCASVVYAFTDQLVGQLDGGWLSLGYGDVSGDLVSLHGQLAWWFNERVGAGLGYSFLDLDVEDRGNRFRDIYDLQMQGPRLILKLAF